MPIKLGSVPKILFQTNDMNDGLGRVAGLLQAKRKPHANAGRTKRLRWSHDFLHGHVGFAAPEWV
ncbi:MAG: hypothetical protein ABI605_15800 [Rhizobacter sp.]